ncbi:sensor histidine kinase [Maliponia aquimaris]|uniref:histidine kinase n=1 Tax=Maliponia aquimaris TaxID=1673631 RepID=A0A238K0P4_9RHOB|nr:ATP-binding protein [Maliponia aquimaris]SMX36017.1 Blue-light-activated protein [Maliponia aquimaris]
MPRHAYDIRLEEMRRAEYGSRGELLIRYGIMAAAVLVLTLTLDPRVTLGWAAAYGTLEASLAAVLILGSGGNARLRYGLALGIYLMSGLCFMTLPIYLIVPPVQTAHAFAGATGIVGLLLYSLQRSQREPGLMAVDCVLVCILGGALAIVLMPQLDSWADRLTVILLIIALGVYYVGSLISGWRQERSLRDAQQRYATSQKARALGQFVGGVAHDFNNQLTAILGFLDLFETLDSPAERSAALNEIRSAAERAARTVQQLLASSGRTRLNPAPIQMGDFLYGLGEVLTDLLDPGMTVEVVPLEDPLAVLADADMLETCVIQLCLNAQDATGGHGLIRLSCERRTSIQALAPMEITAPSCIALIVEDDGPGVAPEALPLLAEPFYTTKSASEGRGLGLSAVAGFARQSGGGLRLESAIQGGLRAVLFLPEAPTSQQLP